MTAIDASKLFSDLAVDLKCEDLPKDVSDRMKNLLLDTIGVIVAASSQAPDCLSLVELAIETGGREEASILAFGNKLPAIMAAFANGAMAHGLDYDDMAYEARNHVSVGIIPACLAMTQRVGKLPGKELLVALTIGAEIQCRVGLSLMTAGTAFLEKWFLTPLVGCFGAAAATSRILGLDRKQVQNALGIAYAQAAGSKEMGNAGIMRAIYGAFPGKAGVLSSLMAQKGVTATESSLEGRAGLFPVYFDNKYKRDILVNDMGKEFRCLKDGFKPWPACGPTHAYIDATLQLVTEHDIAAKDVEQVTAYTDPYLQHQFAEPLEEKRKPKYSINGKFSIPFTVGAALARRTVNIGTFTPAGLKDAEVLAAAKKVTGEISPDVGKVTIKLKSGKTYSRKVDFPLGFPQRPLSNEQVEAKFRDCLSYSAKPLKAGAADKVISLIRNLEKVTDASEIVRWVAP